jgi:hypothetical protein
VISTWRGHVHSISHKSKPNPQDGIKSLTDFCLVSGPMEERLALPAAWVPQTVASRINGPTKVKDDRGVERPFVAGRHHGITPTSVITMHHKKKASIVSRNAPNAIIAAPRAALPCCIQPYSWPARLKRRQFERRLLRYWRLLTRKLSASCKRQHKPYKYPEAAQIPPARVVPYHYVSVPPRTSRGGV